MSCSLPILMHVPHHVEAVPLPCGYCNQCRADKIESWRMRISSEQQYAELEGRGNSFVTFTYNDYHLPRDGSLSKVHLHNFHNAVRTSIKRHYQNVDYKYFSCGEYGDDNGRPHYHCLFLGLDWQRYAPEFAHSWKYGFVDVKPLKSGGIRYVLKYVCKSMSPASEREIYGDLQPPFMSCSPQIGKRWILSHLEEVLENKGYMYKGRIRPLPYYYRRFVEDLTGHSMSFNQSLDDIEAYRLQASNFGMSPYDYKQMQRLMQERTAVARSHNNSQSCNTEVLDILEGRL